MSPCYAIASTGNVLRKKNCECACDFGTMCVVGIRILYKSPFGYTETSRIRGGGGVE
jgi:hypothetical protein